MSYKNFEPPSLLQKHVKCIWYAERNFDRGKKYFEILPDSYVEFVFSVSEHDVFLSSAKEKKLLPDFFTIGLLTEPLRLETSGLLKVIGIRFYPWALPDFSPVEKGDTALTLFSILASLAKEVKQLIQNKDISAARERIERKLISILNVSSESERLADAVEFSNSSEKTHVHSLSEYIAVSVRHFNRLFKSRLGIGPKMYLRQIRFQKIRDRIFENPDVNFTELTYEFGFADQAHLINEFKVFARKTPGTFAAEMKQLREEINRVDVRFLQS